MPLLADLADHLAPSLDRKRYHAEADPAGVWIASNRPVKRLVLRLEPGMPPYDWVEGVDAVLIHRPFGLWPACLPEGVGVIAAHRALDDRLSLGVNPALAEALGLAPEGAPFRYKERDIGMVSRLAEPLPGEAVVARIEAELGGVEAARGPVPELVEAVALMGAMTSELVAQTAERGAAIYVTGQLRPSTFEAVEASGMHVVAVGKARAEAWGLRHLARLIRERWPEVEVVESGLPGR